MGTARRAIGRAVRGACLAALIGCLALNAGTSHAQPDVQREADGKTRLHLRIASMTVAGRKVAPSRPEPSQPVWRHTFGAERRAEATAVRQPVRFSADIVVLQGVTSLAPVRQMFPARRYQVLASRQLLQQAATVAAGAEPAGTTALAVRRDTGLRVTAQDHLIGAAELAAGAGVAAAAATAVRLSGSGRALWVMAFDLAQGCPAGTPPADAAAGVCPAAKPQLDALEAWLSVRLDAGETVILAGRLHRPLGAAPLPGHLGRLARFPMADGIPGTCPGDDGSMAATYVLATRSPHASAETRLDGALQPVDEASDESGCVLMVDASL